jgi:hypothetical protein
VAALSAVAICDALNSIGVLSWPAETSSAGGVFDRNTTNSQEAKAPLHKKRDGAQGSRGRLRRWSGQLLFADVPAHARDSLWRIASTGRLLVSKRLQPSMALGNHPNALAPTHRTSYTFAEVGTSTVGTAKQRQHLRALIEVERTETSIPEADTQCLTNITVDHAQYRVVGRPSHRALADGVG